MKPTSILAVPLALILLAQGIVAPSLYDTYISQHSWTAGHYVGACTGEAVTRFGLRFGMAAWDGFCACHTRTVRGEVPGIPALRGGQNLGPWMRGMVQCTLISTVQGVAVIGADVAHCVANKVNAAINTGGKK